MGYKGQWLCWIHWQNEYDFKEFTLHLMQMIYTQYSFFLWNNRRTLLNRVVIFIFLTYFILLIAIGDQSWFNNFIIGVDY